MFYVKIHQCHCFTAVWAFEWIVAKGGGNTVPLKSMNLIPCTSCRYCVAGCPKQIAIPDLFAVMNTKQIYHDWNADYYYNVVHTGGGKAKASECIKCGKCEKACPQHLHIRDLLVDVAKEFENR